VTLRFRIPMDLKIGRIEFYLSSHFNDVIEDFDSYFDVTFRVLQAGQVLPQVLQILLDLEYKDLVLILMNTPFAIGVYDWRCNCNCNSNCVAKNAKNTLPAYWYPGSFRIAFSLSTSPTERSLGTRDFTSASST
jgi:hypothetical protein